MTGPKVPYSEELHAQKYRGIGESFREYGNRVANALKDDDEHFYAFRDIILDQRFLPGGRVQSAMGASKLVTAFNCFVSGPIVDSLLEGSGSIHDRLGESWRTMRMGGGIGYDWTTLRPRGDVIKKLQSRTNGPIPWMKVYDYGARGIASAGHRRGAQMGVMRVDHPDILEFVMAKQNATELTSMNLSVAITDEFMDALVGGKPFQLRWNGENYRKVDAGEVWDTIMRSTYDWAEPGVLFIDQINRQNNLYYCETIAATNPCVSGDTEILTSRGYERIDMLVDKTVSVWNGFEFSEVTPHITGTNQQMLNITFSNGRSLRCTPYHRFYDKDGSRIEAQDLEPGMKLMKHEWPVIGSVSSVFDTEAYTQGFYSGDGWQDERGRQYIGLYCEKKKLEKHLSVPESSSTYPSKDGSGRIFLYYGKANFEDKMFVPPHDIAYSYRLSWLAGLADSDGYLTKDGSLQISSKHRDFLMNVGFMCNTLGIAAHVSSMKDCWRLSIAASDSVTLKLPTKRLTGYAEPQREARRYIVVVSIEEDGIDEKVYCFTEPKRHSGIFGGVLTAQCGEQPLPPFGACLLGSFNLLKYIDTDDVLPQFNFDRFERDIPPVVRAMDNVTDRTIYPLHEQEAEALSKRRMGLGVCGLANALETMGFPYGSAEFLTEERNILETLRNETYRASIQLAKEKKPFPKFDAPRYLRGQFVRTLPEDIRDGIARHGIRNSHLTSIAPTGTISTCADNVSGGIEPVFKNRMQRTVIEFDGERNEILEDCAYRLYGTRGKEAAECTVSDHLNVLLTAQPYIDSAISKTCNVDTNISFHDFKEVYLAAHAGGAKGCTTYRPHDGGRGAVLQAAPEPVLACSIDPENGQKTCE